MVAHRLHEPAVCRLSFLIEGRAAFYVIDWHGIRSEVTVVEDGESEDEVIDRLSGALWMTRPRGASSEAGLRPQLRLL